MQIQFTSAVPDRAKIKALRLMAASAELVVCSQDADPGVKSALCSMQAEFERVARELEAPTPPAALPVPETTSQQAAA